MTLATFDAAQSAPGTDAPTNLTDRTQQLNQYIIANYGNLTAAAFDAYPQLLYSQPESIVGTLYGSLKRYGGPAEETSFLKWATRFVIKEAQRYKITTEILVEHNDVIHAAINKCLWTSAIDRMVEHQDIYSEVWWLIFQKAHALNRKGPAKLSTRVYSLIKRHVYFYHSSRNTTRRNAVQRNRASIDCEFLSDAELAAMRPTHGKPYDPGYDECGFSMD